MREKILDLLSGKKIDKQPAFSGLIHITQYKDMTPKFRPKKGTFE